ncbi:MAG: ABC transporter permease [Actinomycetota bacterium]
MDFDRLPDLAPQIWDRLLEHIELTVLSVVIGFVISFPLAILAHRQRWFFPPVTITTGLLYTIPSLALFMLLGPWTGLLSQTTAVIGLVSYTLLILIRNIVAGLNAVPSDVKEAAQGMGYSGTQLLWRVELPLAIPVIMAGVRLATVSTIGLVTVAAFIGNGGLGTFILRGFNFFDQTQLVIGSVLSMALAVVVDGLLSLSERRLTPWARRRTVRAAG